MVSTLYSADREGRQIEIGQYSITTAPETESTGESRTEPEATHQKTAKKTPNRIETAFAFFFDRS